MDLVKFLTVSFILFLIGIWGIFFNRKNILVMLMSIELMLLAVNLNFLFFSVALDDVLGLDHNNIGYFCFNEFHY